MNARNLVEAAPALSMSMFRSLFELNQAKRLRIKIAEDTYTSSNGAIFWLSNNAPVPASCFSEAALEAPAAQGEEINIHTNAAINEYILGQANRSPEQIAEENFERRAAFGSGVEVVNMITGERSIT